MLSIEIVSEPADGCNSVDVQAGNDNGTDVDGTDVDGADADADSDSDDDNDADDEEDDARRDEVMRLAKIAAPRTATTDRITKPAIAPPDGPDLALLSVLDAET